MNGLLDFIKTPEGQGLLSAAFGGLAGARRGAPLNSIGRAGLAGLTGYGNALESQDQRAKIAADNELRQLQLSQYKSEAERRAAEIAEKNRIAAILKNAAMPITGTQANAATGQVGPTLKAAEAIGMRPQIDPNALYAQGVPADRIKELFAVQDLGKRKIKEIQTIDIDGKPVKVGIDEFGQQVAQVGTEWRPMKVQDFGGYIGAYNETDPSKITRIGDKTMTPGETASNQIARGNLAVAQGNLGVSRGRLAFDMGGGADGVGANQTGLVKQFGKAPAGFRWKPDGSMEYIPGGPADQKAQLQKSGEGTVGSVVADLRDKYNILNEEGGIVSDQNKAIPNIAARLGSTGLGQTLSGAVGTKAQSARDSIAMARPLLLQSIMKATGMSAKQMDSNAELKMYLATATDPTLGLEANMEALDRIESLYGGGTKQTPKLGTGPRPPSDVMKAADAILGGR